MATSKDASWKTVGFVWGKRSESLNAILDEFGIDKSELARTSNKALKGFEEEFSGKAASAGKKPRPKVFEVSVKEVSL